MGTVAMTRNQTRSPSRFLPAPNEATQPAPMRARSFLKYMSSASKLPKCAPTSYSKPWSAQSISFGNRIRWAELLMGRNSVRPWSRPKMIACRMSTG